jgi:type IX secretion system PorP/SprF family membrane protein
MKNIHIILIALLVFSATALEAQQDAMHTQYIMNKLLINPAYAGYKEVGTATAVHRSQWVGFKGAPMTDVISFDSPLKKGEIALGSILTFDKLGPQSTMGANFSMAYRVRLTNRAVLSFGGCATFELYQAKLSELALTSSYYDQQDQDFMYNVKNLILPNVGFGVYYYKKSHFISLSVPKMIRNKLVGRSSDLYQLLEGRQEPTAYFCAGRVFKVNKELKLQPNVLAKGQWGAPLSVGAHFNAIIYDQFNVGAFYYYREAAGMMFQWQVDPQLKFGYSMDLPVTQLIRTGIGSHEVAVTYTLATRRKRIVYPRYF